MKVGTLVRMRNTLDWNGQAGVITKIPSTRHGMWAILLTSGELIGTKDKTRMEVINASR
jgi:hypothetical protein